MEENRHIFALSRCLKTWIERALRKYHLLMSALQIYISPAKICVMQALRMGYATTLALQRKHNSSQKLWDKIVWSVWLFITRIMKFHGCHMTGCNFYDFILT